MYRFKRQCGYALFMVMLLIVVVGLYLTYEISTKKIKDRSWELQKTATEISYWMDTEYNYAVDQGILSSQNGMNKFSLSDLITNNYLPYGQSRYVLKPSTSQVSEFMCSPLPGMTGSDGALQLSPADTNPTCASAGGGGYPDQHCTTSGAPYTPADYSCSTTRFANTTDNIAKAQYYTNANNISLGNLIHVMAGIGLIIRTPGISNPYITYSGGQMGSLPSNSLAQSLISLLPTSSFNMYATSSPQNSGIGIGSYIYDTSSGPSVVKNDRYSKIIDMGLVQAVGTDTLPSSCYGWDITSGQKTGTGTYTGGASEGTNNKPNDPPVCIQVDTTKYGPGGTVERCDRIDVLYTMFSDYQRTGSGAYWYLNYTNTKIKTVGKYQQIYLPIHADNNPSGGGVYLYSSGKPAQRNYLAYLVRCTRNNTP